MPDEITSSEQKPPFSVSLKHDLYDYLKTMVYTLISVILFFTFIGRLIPVEGTSMLPTLEDGDMMLLQGLFYEPRQGDIVVLTKESFLEEPIVKRVIAVGGQTILIDYDTSTVYVDGLALDEPYIKENMINKYGDAWITETTIPDGCIFVMGDNRNGSDDSRDPQLGIVDTRYVIGHVICVLFPFSNLGLLI